MALLAGHAQAQADADSAARVIAPVANEAAAAPASLSFAQARQWLLSQSPQLAASRAAVESARLRREGMQGLGGPSVAVTGMAYRYSVNAELDLDPVRNSLGNAVGQWASQLPPQMAQSLGPLPQLPSTYYLHREKTEAAANVSVVWPIYMGGLSDAVRIGLDGKTQEAQAQADTTDDAAQRLLVQRYFAAQLASQAAALRAQALEAVRAHDAAAQRMMQAGAIAQVERLQASAALADAQQAAQKALDDAQLAHTALARTLQSQHPVMPSTPLFVLREPLAPLPQWLDQALQYHPGLETVAAKRTQARALHEASEALRRPKVLAFGQRELAVEGKPNWVAGVAVRWTLWDSIDRDKLAAAGQRAIDQADLSEQQVRSDIALLVEKNWLAVEQARHQYFSMQAHEALAQELLRLRQAGLQAGTSTVLDLMDAQLQLAKVQTERASTAHDYVQALAALLESTGQSEQFEQYVHRADVVVTARAP